MTDISGEPSVATRTLSTAEALDCAAAKVRDLVTHHPGGMPAYTEGGRWVLGRDPWAPSWTGGFLTGMLWLFAERSGDPWWRRQAERYCLLLEPRKSDPGTHDIGFVLDPSWGRWYAVEPSEHARDVLVQGGRTMAARRQPGGYLSTWVDAGSTFIDVMMNVEVVFRAAELSGDESLREVALQHCRTSRRFLVRGDGSTVHEGWFDTETGEYLHGATHQGWRSDSSWARGQAWAIHGFAVAYRWSHDPDLLDAARRTADYFIRETPADGVPPNDWTDPRPGLRWESSAGACGAAGMLELADVLAEVAGDPDAAARYRGYGLGILRTLRSTEFTAADAPDWQGVLRHATYHAHQQIGVDESVMWGDYYYVAALHRAAQLEAGAS